MEQVLGFVTGVPKIAIFLSLFAAVAFIFEIFFFRRKRTSDTTELAQVSAPKQFPKRNLLIIGIVLIGLALPVSLYVVLQQVRFQKEAQPQQRFGCDQIDILQNNVPVEPSSLAISSTVTFVGYCFVEGSSPGQTSINRLRFVVTTPSGSTNTVVYLAFAAPEKSRENMQYVKASYPNFTLPQQGTYTVQIWAYDRDVAKTSEPFTRTFTVASGAASTEVGDPTPTPIQSGPTPQVAVGGGNKTPTCNSLSAIPLTGPAPLTVSLTGSGSDSDGQVTAFEFTFGDGKRQTVTKNVGKSGSASTSHVYQDAQEYTATLRVQDNSGNFSTASALCRVTLSVSKGAATTSAILRAQPTKTVSLTPIPVTLPQVGTSLPMVGLIGGGLFLLTFGLLLAF